MDKGRLFLLIAMGVAGLALLLHIVGVATNAWVVIPAVPGLTDRVTFGLWKGCGSSGCAEFPEASLTDRLKAARAMEILAILVAVPGLVLLCLRYFLSSLSDNKIVYILCPILMGVAGVLGLIGVPLYCQEPLCDDNGGYSLGLAIVGAILYVIVAPCALLAKPAALGA